MSPCFLVRVGSWHLQRQHPPRTLSSVSKSALHSLLFCASVWCGIQRPFHALIRVDPPMAHRIPHLLRSEPSDFFSSLVSFLKIHSWLLLLNSEAFALQFEEDGLTRCLLGGGGELAGGGELEPAHLAAAVCLCRCHVILRGSCSVSGNALGGGEWTGPPGCHPGRQSERLKGGEGGTGQPCPWFSSL